MQEMTIEDKAVFLFYEWEDVASWAMCVPSIRCGCRQDFVLIICDVIFPTY